MVLITVKGVCQPDKQLVIPETTFCSPVTPDPTHPFLCNVAEGPESIRGRVPKLTSLGAIVELLRHGRSFELLSLQ